MPLAIPAEFETYVNSHPPSLGLNPATKYTLTAVAGGNANFVFRLASASALPTILKHAEPFIRDHPGIAFPLDRVNTEAHVLRTLPSLLPASVNSEAVEAVALIGYDEQAHTLHLADAGNRTLKDAYADMSTDTVQATGRRLGRWIAILHSATEKLSEDVLGVNSVGRTMYRFLYNNIGESLAKSGLDQGLGDAVNAEFGSKLATDDVCQCHGDFWPANVILDDSEEPRLTVIDWEMSRRGNGATDVAQFAAEAWLLDRFRGHKGLMNAFLKAYAATRQIGDEDRVRVAVHFGTHLAYWPTQLQWVQWGNNEETTECVKLGVEIMERAMARDLAWFEGSVLKELFMKRVG
jgi:aminoglycoside phosphotransferase (APT) family kinase protein